MTEFHADNLNRSLRDHGAAFQQAREAGDWEAAHKAWLRLMAAANVVIGEARASRIEAEALSAELQTYRPTRGGRPAAPPLDGYTYVFTASFPWVCAAVELRKQVWVNAGHGYFQECHIPERKTLCGKKTTFPVNERFPSGGWPRLHELCSDCIQVLVAKGFGEHFTPPTETAEEFKLRA